MSCVNVALILDDSYVIGRTQTDSKGQFKFNTLENGNYVLRFSFPGYSDTSVSIIDLTRNYEVKDVRMNIISYQLEEVAVSAKTVNQDVDRMIFFPSQKMRESSQDALDIIRLLNMPGIKFDIVNHSFSSLNNGTVQIRIDGVISSQKDMIALQPQDIARIEYINNPGIIYGEGLSAVILVKTRNNFVGIQSGVRIAHSLTTPLGNGYTYINLVKPFDRFSFKFAGNYKLVNGNYALQTKNFNYPSNILHLENKGEAYQNQDYSPMAQLDYTHSFAEKNFLNISLKYSSNLSNPTDILSNAFTDGEHFYSEQTKTKDKVHNTSLDIYYSKSLVSGSQIDVNITGTYINTDYSDIYSKKYMSDNYSDYNYNYLADGKHSSVIGEFKYDMPIFTDYHLTFGTRNTYSVTQNNYTVKRQITPSEMNIFSTYNYVELSGNIARLNYSVGGGLSYTNRKDDLNGRHYLFFRPKLLLQIPFSKQWSSTI